MLIREYQPEDKPREKMLRNGANTLTDTELLAILLRTGAKGFSVMEVARTLLNNHKDIYKLSQQSVPELAKVKGMGITKAITLLAAIELGIRASRESQNLLDTPVTSADTLADYFIPRIGNNQSESFYVICLSSANRVINYKEVTKGILDSTTIHAREVFRVAIEHNAKSIIIMHNHPSGNTQPSEQDIELTRTLAQAGKIIGISVLDHLIITRGSYRSLFAMGYF